MLYLVLGKEIKEEPTDMEKCMAEVNIGADVDSEYEKRIKQRILAEYEASIQHKQDVPPHGIQPVEKTCRYPIHVGDVKSTECSALEGNYELAPKHIDTPAEIREKYYSDVLRRHEAICTEGKPIECSEPPKIGEEQSICDKKPEQTKPIMVHPLQLPEDACKVKTVKFAEGPDRCVRDRYDLCDLNTEKTQCDCTDYKKC